MRRTLTMLATACLFAMTACGDSSGPVVLDSGPGDSSTADLFQLPDTNQNTDLPATGNGQFGDNCTGDPDCSAGLTCVITGLGGGFCSQSCSQSGAPCQGVPQGTFAACIIQTQQGGPLFCGFICQAPGQQGQPPQSFPCPSQLNCAAQDNPPGSGQRVCEAAGGGGNQTCSQVLACAGACADQACANQCLSQASQAALPLLQALITCQNNASQGACSGQCANPGQACNQCLTTECMNELNACQAQQ